MTLIKEECIPCKGGIPPLDAQGVELFLEEVTNWVATHDSTRIEREFSFDDFATALKFVDAIGALSESQGHHPDISFGWGYATVVFYTHKINGLHKNDFVMAAKTDQLAADIK